LIGLPPADLEEEEPQQSSRHLWRRLRLNPSFWVGGFLVTLIVGIAIFAPLLAPHDPTQLFNDGISTIGAPLGPNHKFPLGTDSLGRDVLSRLVYGARLSLAISILGNLLAVILGVSMGAVAAWSRGWVEQIIMRFTDIMLAFPALLLAMALVAIKGASLTIIVIVIGMVSWTGLCRITYGQVVALREREWVESAQAMGVGSVRILVRHILPHLAAPIVVYATLGIGLTVVFEATLSYLGLGVPPPAPSWGRMIQDGANPNVLQFWWLMLFPSLALFATVLSFNLLGDALRDALDPRGHEGNAFGYRRR
jgi:peptide/nickel transport system permease protein